MLPFESMQSWLYSPFALASYIPFTNQQFVAVERNDSNFFQNTKAFFIVFIPFSLIVFTILNKIFYSLYDYQISSFLRLYSFWTQLFVIMFLQNIYILTVYSIVHISNLFSLDFIIHLLNSLILGIIGIIFIVIICLIPMTVYFYGKLSKYFLYNLHPKRPAYIIMFVRYIVKPIL